MKILGVKHNDDNNRRIGGKGIFIILVTAALALSALVAMAKSIKSNDKRQEIKCSDDANQELVYNEDEEQNLAYYEVEVNTEEGYRIINYEGSLYRIPLYGYVKKDHSVGLTTDNDPATYRIVLYFRLRKQDGKICLVEELVDKELATKVINSDGTISYSNENYPGYELDGEFVYQTTTISYDLDMFEAVEEKVSGK